MEDALDACQAPCMIAVIITNMGCSSSSSSKVLTDISTQSLHQQGPYVKTHPVECMCQLICVHFRLCMQQCKLGRFCVAMSLLRVMI